MRTVLSSGHGVHCEINTEAETAMMVQNCSARQGCKGDGAQTSIQLLVLLVDSVTWYRLTSCQVADNHARRSFFDMVFGMVQHQRAASYLWGAGMPPRCKAHQLMTTWKRCPVDMCLHPLDCIATQLYTTQPPSPAACHPTCGCPKSIYVHLFVSLITALDNNALHHLHQMNCLTNFLHTQLGNND